MMAVHADDLEIGGNHYDSPCGYFKKLDSGWNENYEAINEDLKEKIKKEFSGNHPPTANGSLVLKKAYEVIQEAGTMRCSAYVQELDCFCGGVLSLSTMDFIPCLGNTSTSRSFIMNIIEKHRNTFSNLMKEL